MSSYQMQRLYQVELVRDLFGDWTIILSWGGLGSRQGQMRVIDVPSQAAGVERIESIRKRRQQRGYREQPPIQRTAQDATQGLV